MSPKSFRRTVAALFLASFAALAPSHAFELGRRSVERPARILPVRGFFARLRELFDLVKEQVEHGGGMDPNGTPNGPE